jgi:hypothetical protein
VKPFYQVAFVVESLEESMAELTRAVGVRWHVPYESPDLRVAISIEGPPHFEIIQGAAGGPWDSTLGSRFDHLQWWTTDMEADTRALVDAGLTLTHDFDGGLRYFHAPHTGARLELLRGDPSRPGGVPENYVTTAYGVGGEWTG